MLRRGGDIFVYQNSCPHTRESLDPTGGSVASPDGLLLPLPAPRRGFVADTGEVRRRPPARASASHPLPSP